MTAPPPRRRLRRALAAAAAGLTVAAGGLYLTVGQSPGSRLGMSLEEWVAGGWNSWDTAAWRGGAGDFVNPVIDGLWELDRMRGAQDPGKTVDSSVPGAGVSDPEPAPVAAQPVTTPYSRNAAPLGKVFFDGPEGSMVCSGTVVQDPADPGRSNLVWTAGHCVHAGKEGGWFRNIVFVPSFNDQGLPQRELANTSEERTNPFGTWWAEAAATSAQWITEGTATGGDGAPYDYAVLRVKPEAGSGRTSLEETVGTALPISFNSAEPQDIGRLGAWGYPAAEPFDGATMHTCEDTAGRLSIRADQPTMHRIGCTMTGGSSGGGWFTRSGDGRVVLVSNTSIGPRPAGWLAGPYLGPEAAALLDRVRPAG